MSAAKPLSPQMVKAHVTLGVFYMALEAAVAAVAALDDEDFVRLTATERNTLANREGTESERRAVEQSVTMLADARAAVRARRGGAS